MMSVKDWVLLLIPILCNGVVVFLLQKSFEKRQLSTTEKYKYVSVLQHKVDDALVLFTKVLQTTGNDSIQISFLNQFISGYCDVFYYYQQNQTIFKALKQYMDEIMRIHERIKNQQEQHDDNERVDGDMNYENYFRRIFELLQTIQVQCIQHKI